MLLQMHAMKSMLTGHRKEDAGHHASGTGAHGTSSTSSSSRFPHTISVRVGDLALGTSLPETLARGKFHPYLMMRVLPASTAGGSSGGMSSMFGGMMSSANRSAKTKTITNGWNSSSSAYA